MPVARLPQVVEPADRAVRQQRPAHELVELAFVDVLELPGVGPVRDRGRRVEQHEAVALEEGLQRPAY